MSATGAIAAAIGTSLVSELAAATKQPIPATASVGIVLARIADQKVQV
jgi:hypothetical protein